MTPTIRTDDAEGLTLGALIAAVVDAAGDERRGVAVVARMLHRGTIRRRRPSEAPVPIPRVS